MKSQLQLREKYSICPTKSEENITRTYNNQKLQMKPYKEGNLLIKRRKKLKRKLNHKSK
jgi:hypothetical protein